MEEVPEYEYVPVVVVFSVVKDHDFLVNGCPCLSVASLSTVTVYFLFSFNFDFGLIVNLVELALTEVVNETEGEKLNALITESIFIGSEKVRVILVLLETFFLLLLGE